MFYKTLYVNNMYKFVKYYSRDPIELRKHFQKNNDGNYNKKRQIGLLITVLNLLILFFIFTYISKEKHTLIPKDKKTPVINSVSKP